MREKFMRFMQGRYGVDAFSRFLMTAGLVVLVLNMFLRSGLVSLLVLAMLIYVYYRMFSRNYGKRYEENRKFLEIRTRVLYKFSQRKSEMAQRKTHHIYRCPSCGQKIRVPKGKGNIIVTCPKCKTEFQKKS